MTAPTGLYHAPERDPTLKEAAMEAVIAAELEQTFGINEARRQAARERLLEAFAKEGIDEGLMIGMGRVLL
jgi:hypothetical protein